MTDIDILSIHQEILRKFKEDEDSLSDYKKKLEMIDESMKLPNLLHKTTKTLSENKTSLENKIYDIEQKISYNFYIMETAEYLERYKILLTNPRKINFMGVKTDVEDGDKTELIINYCNIAKNYSDINLNLNSISKSKIQCQNISCPNKKNIDIVDNNYVCISCGMMLGVVSNYSSYKDVERVNMSTKYTYDRKIHFRDCINQFQGKQNSTIDQQVYDKLIEQFERHGLLESGDTTHKRCKYITKEHIYIFLKDTGYSKHYEDVVLIHHILTGIKPEDISELEPQLLDDFDVLTNAYDQKYRRNGQIDRKNFINTQYVLFQLLRRHKYPCKRADFNILKTMDRKSFHDDVCKSLFEQLGWNFTALF